MSETKSSSATMSPVTESTNHVSISRVLNAPRELVFEAWTKPEHLARWCNLDGIKTEQMDVDVRVGGEWNYKLRTPDGAEIRIARIFREIVSPERIVFYEKCKLAGNVILDGTHIIRFTDVNGKTRIDISCDLATPFDADNQRGWGGGWSQLLDHLEGHLSAKKA